MWVFGHVNSSRRNQNVKHRAELMAFNCQSLEVLESISEETGTFSKRKIDNEEKPGKAYAAVKIVLFMLGQLIKVEVKVTLPQTAC